MILNLQTRLFLFWLFAFYNNSLKGVQKKNQQIIFKWLFVCGIQKFPILIFLKFEILNYLDISAIFKQSHQAEPKCSGS